VRQHELRDELPALKDFGVTRIRRETWPNWGNLTPSIYLAAKLLWNADADVDASNLERNLYLTVQLLEMEANLVVALNMMDTARSLNYNINVAELSHQLGAPVVPMVASRNQGVEELKQTIIDVATGKEKIAGLRLKYGSEVEEELGKLERIISRSPLATDYSPRWLAVKLLEGDSEIVEKFKEAKVG
jgi:ferrous iron transport protein B